MTKNEKLVPVIKKLLTRFFGQNVELINISVNSEIKCQITIVYKLKPTIGLLGSIGVHNQIDNILNSVLNINSWEYRIIKKNY